MTGDEPRKTTPDVDPTRWPPWKKWVITLAGSLLGLIALAVIIMTIRGKHGRETKIRMPDDSGVAVDGVPGRIEIKSSAKARDKVSGSIGPTSPSGEPGTPIVAKRPAPPSADVGTPTFIPLFNGKDLSGWWVTGNSQHKWTVIQGRVVAGSGSPGLSTLTTERTDFANFHLRVETKVADGRPGGIAFRISERNGESAEYIAVIAGTNSGEFTTGDLKISTMSEVLARADPVVSIQPGEWFTEEVIADGDIITVIAQGIEVVKFKLLHRKLLYGAIGLICRPNSRVVFRKIEIKELKGTGVGGSSASGGESENVPGPFDWGRTARITGNGNWQIDGDELIQTTDTKLTGLVFGDPMWTDYSFSADVKLAQDKSDVGLTIRSMAEKKGSYWYGAGNGSSAIFRWVDGQFDILATRQSFSRGVPRCPR